MPTRDIIGRDAELELVSALISETSEAGAALLVWGEAGIGKSTLLRAAADLAHANGRNLLETTGVEAEALLPYAALHQLLHPVLAYAERLPDVQHRALLAAFGVEDSAGSEPFLVSLATLNLLAEVASEQPLMVLVDDVQWLDQASHDTLAFVARRVSRDPIALIGVIRRGYSGPFATAGLAELEVVGLDDESSRQLLTSVDPSLEHADRERIVREASGNPLALVELPVAWSATTNHSESDPHFVPLTARLERSFASRISQQAQTVRDAVLVAAVDFENQVSEIVAAASVLAGTPVTVDALDAAAAANLLRIDGTRVRFRHPLVRSGIVQAESSARRRAAHATLADVLDHEPYRRTWHRAQAIVGPDDAVADELEDSSRISLARGSVDSAIWALERSAQLSSDPAVRGRRLLLAAEHAFGLGRADMVDRLLTAASGSSLSDLDRARMEWLREIFNDGIPGDATRVFELCQIAQQAAQADDASLALNLLLGAALRGWWADTGPAAMARVVEVTHELRGSEHDPRHIAALAVAEPVLQGATVLDRLATVVIERVDDADALRLLGMAAHAVGNQPLAASFLDRAERRLRDQGRLGLLPHVLGMSGSVCLDLGDWERAHTASAEGRRLAEETGQPIWSTGTLVNDNRAYGLMGDIERTMELAAEVENTPALRDLNDFLACAQLARAYAWCSKGNFTEAFKAVRRVFDPTDVAYHQRERFCGVMCLAEAAVHSEHVDEAREIVDEMERVAKVTPSPLLHVHLLYARAVLAQDDEADTLYTTGLAADLRHWPWVRAHLELAYGSWLRRQRRVAESRSHLRAAQTTFRAIGATSAEERARVELRASGERVSVGRTGAQALLSAQELQIARLAAEGMSNKEIGERLFLSPRTIGSHLYRIFPKLDITSRGQLAARLAES